MAAQLWAGVTSLTTTNLDIIWNNNARDTTTDRGTDLLETARIYALMNVSDARRHHDVADKQVCATDFWRPITAIREGRS